MTKQSLARSTRNTNGYKGVGWFGDRKLFRARITDFEVGKARKIRYSRGKGFNTAIEAAMAYDEMARELYGNKAILNFPNDGELKVFIGTVDEIGSCLKGHTYKDHGYRNKNKGYIECKLCISEGMKVMRARRRMRQEISNE